MRINNNLMAMNTHRQLGLNNAAGAKSIEKLSSGLRINRAGDDAAGLAISEKMRGQIRGLNQASRNSQDGISMIQTAEGALNETHAILQRMRELAVQSANDTNVNADRSSIQNEIDELSKEITRIADTTEFNTQSLLDGTLDDVKFQIGANENQELALEIGDMGATGLNIVSDSVVIGKAGEAVESVGADIAFDVENTVLTAVEGGAVAAEMDAKASGVNTDGFATDVEMPFTVGVTNAESVSFNGTNEIAFSTSGDIAWDKVITSGQTATIDITAAGSGVNVSISIIASGGAGRITHTVNDTIYANSGGSYTYEAHGMKFELTADDFADLTTAGNSGVAVDLNGGIAVSGASTDIATGNVDTLSVYNQTLDGSGTTYGDFTTAITFDVTDSEWNANFSSIEISGNGLETSGGTITVTLYSGGGVISSDIYTLSGGAAFSGNTFTYDNHGVSFAYDVNNTTDFDATMAVTQLPNSVEATNSATDFELTVSDDNGAEITFTVSFNSGETYSLSGVINAINAAGSGTAGTFASDIAVIDGDSIKLQSQDLGADSEVTIVDAGQLADIFTTAGTKTGADSSIDLTLADLSGTTIDTATIAPSATNVTFSDSDGNEAEFTFKGYSDLTNVDVADAFSASEITREVTGIDVSSREAASAAITTISDAIETVSKERSKLGAIQNRLEHTIKNLDTSAENLQASESRIRDVDMAKEMMEFTKNNILSQAAQSMLAQANQAPQGVLQLLR